MKRYKVVSYEVESDSGTGRTWWHTREVEDCNGDYVLYSEVAEIQIGTAKHCANAMPDGCVCEPCNILREALKGNLNAI
jgi:hypothetical protein